MKSSHQKSLPRELTAHVPEPLRVRLTLPGNWDREKALALAKDATKHSMCRHNEELEQTVAGVSCGWKGSEVSKIGMESKLRLRGAVGWGTTQHQFTWMLSPFLLPGWPVLAFIQARSCIWHLPCPAS